MPNSPRASPIVWLRTTWSKPGSPVGGTPKAADWLRSNCWASRGNWRIGRATAELCEGVTTWSFWRLTGSKPECRERTGPAIARRADQSRSPEVRERSSLSRGGGRCYESLPRISENKVIQDLTERLAELKREYARLSTTFNEDYPRVKEIQSQADEIAAAIQEQRKSAANQITTTISPRSGGRTWSGRQSARSKKIWIRCSAGRAIQHSQARSRHT